MQTGFSEALTRLRHERGLSQKQAAADLGISQALLSHYENGIREPRLEFVIRACDYYQVSADRILGRGGEESLGNVHHIVEVRITLIELDSCKLRIVHCIHSFVTE